MLIIWLSKKVDIHDRICTICNTRAIENEQHFLLECTAYKFLQENFILKLEKVGKMCLLIYV